MEEWITIDAFEQYEVSSTGLVRRRGAEAALRPKTNQYGVVCIGMVKDGTQMHRSIPLLVATAFLPRPKPQFDTPINLDGDRYNNAVENLAWRPRWFAVEYNRQFRERFAAPILQTIIDIDTRIKYRDSLHVATTFGLLEKDVVLSILNKTYVWPTWHMFEIA